MLTTETREPYLVLTNHAHNDFCALIPNGGTFTHDDVKRVLFAGLHSADVEQLSDRQDENKRTTAFAFRCNAICEHIIVSIVFRGEFLPDGISEKAYISRVKLDYRRK